MLQTTCSPAELEALRERHLSNRQVDLLHYWCRKESVLKATGDGLNVDLTGLQVSGPDEAPVLVDWPGRPEVVESTRLHVLDPGIGYVAYVSLIGGPPVPIEEYNAAALLS